MFQVADIVAELFILGNLMVFVLELSFKNRHLQLVILQLLKQVLGLFCLALVEVAEEVEGALEGF
jgi:hypothetical protein